MGILAWIVLGVAAGLAARPLMPSRDPGGLVATIVLGVVGAVVAGFVATLVGFGSVNGVSWSSVVASVAGAVAALLIYRFLLAPRSPASS